MISSQDDYRETQTLKKRLQALAIAMGLRAQQQKQKTTEDTPPMLSSSSTTDEHTDASSHLAQNLDDTSARNIADACTAAHKSEESGIASDIPLTSNASSEKTIVIHRCTEIATISTKQPRCRAQKDW